MKEEIVHPSVELRKSREKAKKSVDQTAFDMAINAEWLLAWETGTQNVPLYMLQRLLEYYGQDVHSFLAEVDITQLYSPRRELSIEEAPKGINLVFFYGDHQARVLLTNATVDDARKELDTFQENIRTLTKADAISSSFLSAVRRWKSVNPADLWNFFLHQAYLDRYVHPLSEATRDLEQSWKRSAGWAFERVIVEHYNPKLEKYGIELVIPKSSSHTKRLIERLGIEDSSVKDKADIYITDGNFGDEKLYGVVHAKVSIAERRSDDEPLSVLLQSKNLFSPFVTLDAKSFPGPNPVNRGEYGPVQSKDLQLAGKYLSEKRVAVEDKGVFSNVYSFNINTQPTPPEQQAKARIYAVSFHDEEDSFVKDLANFVRSFEENRIA